MKPRRTLLTLAAALAAALSFTALPAAAQNYKSEYRMSLVVGAPMFRQSIRTESAMIGMVTVMTWLVMFHGSHLNLKKISQTKNE